MAGCVSRDNDALRAELEAFRLRLGPLVAEPAAASSRARPADALAACTDRIDPSQEGGTP